MPEDKFAEINAITILEIERGRKEDLDRKVAQLFHQPVSSSALCLDCGKQADRICFDGWYRCHPCFEKAFGNPASEGVSDGKNAREKSEEGQVGGRKARSET